MESFQGYFASKMGQKSTNGRSTLQIPTSPRLFTSVTQVTEGPSGTAVYTESQPHTSLVQKIAARFVPASGCPSSQDVADGSGTPRSRGGNPIHHPQLFSSSMHKPERRPVHFESQKPHKEVKEVEVNGTGKYGYSPLSIMILLWLLNQREILKDLSDIRNSSVEDLKHLQKTQDAVHTQVTSLEQKLKALHIIIESQHQQVKSEMANMKRLVGVFGMFQMVVVVTVLLCSSKSFRRMYHAWYRHLHKSFVQPTVSMLNHCKNISQMLIYEFSDTVYHYKELISYSILEAATHVFNRVTKKTPKTG